MKSEKEAYINRVKDDFRRAEQKDAERYQCAATLPFFRASAEAAGRLFDLDKSQANKESYTASLKQWKSAADDCIQKHLGATNPLMMR